MKEISKDELEFGHPGRPLDERTYEIFEQLEAARDNDMFGIQIDLRDDEIEHFYRFSQRTRSAAKRLGVKVNVSMSRKDKTKGNVRLVS